MSERYLRIDYTKSELPAQVQKVQEEPLGVTPFTPLYKARLAQAVSLSWRLSGLLWKPGLGSSVSMASASCTVYIVPSLPERDSHTSPDREPLASLHLALVKTSRLGFVYSQGADSVE